MGVSVKQQGNLSPFLITLVADVLLHLATKGCKQIFIRGQSLRGIRERRC